MKARLVRFGVVEIDGQTFEHDVVIEHGQVRERDKRPSRRYRGKFGHTPLSKAEDLPWNCDQLIIGTGMESAVPILRGVKAEAKRRKVSMVVLPTDQACRLIDSLESEQVCAVLHVTC